MIYTITAFNGQPVAINQTFARLIDTLHLCMTGGVNGGAYTIRNANGKIIFADTSIKDLFFLLLFHPRGQALQG